MVCLLDVPERPVLLLGEIVVARSEERGVEERRNGKEMGGKNYIFSRYYMREE